MCCLFFSLDSTVPTHHPHLTWLVSPPIVFFFRKRICPCGVRCFTWNHVFKKKHLLKSTLWRHHCLQGPYVKLMLVEMQPSWIRWMRSWVKKKPQRWRSLLAIWVGSIRREKCCRLDHPYGSWETFTTQQTRRMYTFDSFELFLGWVLSQVSQDNKIGW